MTPLGGYDMDSTGRASWRQLDREATARPPVPVAAGQVRADKYGSTLQVKCPTPASRWLCVYPQLDDETVIMGAPAIMECYPIVVSAGGAAGP